MDDPRRSLLRPISALLLVSQLAGAALTLVAAAPAQAATAAAPSGLVLRAQGYYRDARYDEAVGLLAGPVMRKELAGQELIDARLVLARCYVKKGITPRAREHFGAILAIDPAFTLTKSQVDAEELAVFNEVKGSHGAAAAPPVAAAGKAAPPAAAAAKGAGAPPAATTGKGATTDPTASKTATPPATTAPAAPTAQAQPPMHKPETEASSGEKKGWLSRNKYLALGLLAGTAVAVGVAASSGGSDTPTVSGTSVLPGFPGVPPGH